MNSKTWPRFKVYSGPGSLGERFPGAADGRTGFESPYPRQMTLPHIQQIIPVAVKQPFDDPEWVFEFKYDGFRALYYIEEGRSWFVSRNGNHLTRFDDLCHQLVRELDVGNAVLDGEVIATDETGRPCLMAPDRSGARRRREIKIDALGPRGAHQLRQAESSDVVTH